MAVRFLQIQRYQGIRSFEWAPEPGINCLIGSGDVGKSTILSALSLLLSPRANPTATEYDYFHRVVDDGFEITAVLGDLPAAITDSLRSAPYVGWLDGKVVPLPDEDGAERVMRVRVSGSSEMETTHEILAPSFETTGETFPFTVGVRRNLLATEIVSGARAFTELRLGRGSLLERHVSADQFRRAVSSAVALASAELAIPQDAEAAMTALRKLFSTGGVPSDLFLGIVAPPERSLPWLVSLLTGSTLEDAIPVALSGAGTTQMALFLLAGALAGQEPILIMDEPEIGLEPYRQRILVSEIRALIDRGGQAFMATHSPAILSVLKSGEVIRVGAGALAQPLTGRSVDALLAEAPLTFLARVPILCEGATEAGFLGSVLDPLLRRDGLTLDALGAELVAREGQPSVLREGLALVEAGISHAVFVDSETTHAGLRARLASEPTCHLSTWSGVRNIEEAVASWLPFPQLSDVVELAATLQDRNVEALLQQIGEIIGTPGKRTLYDLSLIHGEHAVRAAVATAMQAKKKAWFKDRGRGAALGSLLFRLGLPPEIESTLAEFAVGIRDLGK